MADEFWNAVLMLRESILLLSRGVSMTPLLRRRGYLWLLRSRLEKIHKAIFQCGTSWSHYWNMWATDYLPPRHWYVTVICCGVTGSSHLFFTSIVTWTNQRNEFQDCVTTYGGNWCRTRAFIHDCQGLRFLQFSTVRCLIKKKNAALLLSILRKYSSENQFAPFRISCVQFPRICLFHSLQMRLWTNRVTLQISIPNPFLDARLSRRISPEVERESHPRTSSLWTVKEWGFVLVLSCQAPLLQDVSHFRCWHEMRSQFGGCIQYGSTRSLAHINTYWRPIEWMKLTGVSCCCPFCWINDCVWIINCYSTCKIKLNWICRSQILQ